MFGMLIAMWVFMMPVLIFIALVKNERDRKARYAAHVEWVNSVNRANFEKLGVFV